MGREGLESGWQGPEDQLSYVLHSHHGLLCSGPLRIGSSGLSHAGQSHSGFWGSLVTFSQAAHYIMCKTVIQETGDGALHSL